MQFACQLKILYIEVGFGHADIPWVIEYMIMVYLTSLPGVETP